MKMIKRLAAALLGSLLMLRMLPLMPASGADGAAAEYTRTAAYRASTGYNTAALTDGREGTTCSFPAGSSLTISCEDLICGISLKFDRKAVQWRAAVGQFDEMFGQNGFLHDFADISHYYTNTVTLTFQAAASVSEIRIFGAGTLPADVQVWEPPCTKADLMLCSTHSDDEHLFFLGLIPTMVAKGYRVQVVYFVQHNGEPMRLHEQLNGLWTAGLHTYPALSRFPDQYSTSLAGAKNHFAAAGYSYDTLVSYQVEMLRRFKPEVVVGHDVNGEYGHGQHRLNTDTLMRALNVSADAASYPASAQRWGVWDVPKTYLHLWAQNPLVMNYDTPLEHYGGRTAYQVSIAAYSCHNSQQYTWFTRWAKGNAGQFTKATQITSYSPCRFGLYRSAVGLDSGIGDMFEHIGGLKGDADRDGAVTVRDAQIVLQDYTERFAGNAPLLGTISARACDVDGDGAVTAADSQLILRYYTENKLSGGTADWDSLLAAGSEIAETGAF